jgi:cob(I)alamin adenosyltransferase
LERIYTRSGDEGETGLLFGERVPKADLRCEAYGTLDEAKAALGLARAHSRDAYLKELIEELQSGLSRLCTELASEPARRAEFEKRFQPVDASMTQRLEELIDTLSAQMGPLRGFVMPGGSAASAALDMSRAIVRRAERRAVALKEQGLLPNPEAIRYLNRLSDLLFVMARYEDRGKTAKAER